MFRAICRETHQRMVTKVVIEELGAALAQPNVLIHQPFIVSPISPTEHTHKDERIHAVFHPPSHKDMSAPHLQTLHILRHHRQLPADFRHKFRKQIFIRIKPQHPLRVYRKMVQSPVKLCGLVAGIGMYHHLHVRECLADFHGFVGRGGIYYIYFLREGADVLQTSANVQLFVVGQDDGSDVKHNA